MTEPTEGPENWPIEDTPEEPTPDEVKEETRNPGDSERVTRSQPK